MRKTLLSAVMAGVFTILISTCAISQPQDQQNPANPQGPANPQPMQPAPATPDQSTTPTQPANGTAGTSLPSCKVSQTTSSQLECSCSQGNLSFTFDANTLNLLCK